MSSGTTEVRFGDVMKPNRRPYTLGPTEDANLVGMRLYGGGPFHRELKPALNIAKKSHFVIRSGDVIYNKLFAWKGTFGIVPPEFDGMFVSDKFPTYELDRNRVNDRYLLWFFRQPGVWEQARMMSIGSAALSKLTLNPPKFLELRLPLPPLAEQQRIVARIEDVAEKVNAAQRLLRESRRMLRIAHAKAVLAVFDGHECDHRTVGDCFRVTTGGTPSRSNAAYWDGDVPWVSSGEVAFSKIARTREKITELGVANSNAKLNPEGTVLVAMIGQGKTRGQCAVLACRAATNQNVASIHVPETDHVSDYVYWWFRANYERSRELETGTAQPALSAGRVKAMRIPLPARSEQLKAIGRLESLQATHDAIELDRSAAEVELDALLPAVLDRAFKGEP